MTPDHPAAPSYDSLPKPIPRAVRAGGNERTTFDVRIEVVTPILGGAPIPRTIDEIDVVRAATVRGHLRFWWRALNAHTFSNPQELYRKESALWGRAAQEGGGRSAVDLRIEIEHAANIDDSGIRLYRSREGEATPGAYALWPAREERRRNLRTAPRRAPGTRFLMTLAAPSDEIQEVKNAVRAWVLFGGYGSRARRGLGSLQVLDRPNGWLPTQATRQQLTALFGRDAFAAPARSSNDLPVLAGAALHVGTSNPDAQAAWTTALDWLKEFRQGYNGGSGNRAREPGTGKPQPNRPSISNWPEADKIRHLASKTIAHRPRYNVTPAWPRAGFGLPINGQFQTEARSGGLYDEPAPFELRWRAPNENADRDRLASPLIVKAMPLANGTFVPIALWFNRAYPQGEVVLHGVARSAAPFDRLMAPSETSRFSALTGKSSLREAFLDWLRPKTTVVVP